MAVTQLRCEPRAQTLYENARSHGHTKKEARRILKTPPLRRHLPSHDPRPRTTRRRSSPPRCITACGFRAVKEWPDRAQRSEAAQRHP